ncbi:hypothetical protein JCM16161A_12900 [Vulcanisaeta sp. JCM 16161]|uniref:hypothetical protein n=1 Tax=Vulcanisaeta sp. JCM 16161 TaxID=1295372 RepID=UPI0006CFEB16|nr:hypothetical protein [Vulcanisaeta sp. JCM 16161]
MVLNGLRICWGKKVRGSRRLECGEEVDDPRVVEETMRLINEFLSRVEKHRAILFSNSTTPFDEPIRALSNWLREIRVKIEESSNENITNLRRAMLDAGEKTLELLNQAREKWLSTYRRELEELISKLKSEEVRIIISGEPFNKNKSFVAHFYTESLTIYLERVAKTESITITLRLNGLRGTYISVPILFSGNTLRAMQYGLLLTDGSISKDRYPEMGTNQLWQVITWLSAWPRKNHMRIRGVSINDNGINIMWNLMAINHRGTLKSKTEVVKEASKLNNEDFLIFLLFAILGDGSVDIKMKTVKLSMSEIKRKTWDNLIEILKDLKFREKNEGHLIGYKVCPSKAVELVSRILSDTLIKALFEDLSLLPDAEKLRRLITLASMKVKPRGWSSIEVAGIKMTVSVNDIGHVELKAVRKDYEAVLETLKNAGYDAELSRRGKRYVVYMGIDVIRKYPELVSKVCEVLRRTHEEAASEGKERRAKAITRAMERLNCPTQSPRAKNHHT